MKRVDVSDNEVKALNSINEKLKKGKNPNRPVKIKKTLYIKKETDDKLREMVYEGETSRFIDHLVNVAYKKYKARQEEGPNTVR